MSDAGACYATGRHEDATWSARRVLLCGLRAHEGRRHFDERGGTWWSQEPGEDQAVIYGTVPPPATRMLAGFR